MLCFFYPYEKAIDRYLKIRSNSKTLLEVCLNEKDYIVFKIGDDKGEQYIKMIPKNRIWSIYFHEDKKYIRIQYGNSSTDITNTSFANFKKIVKEIYGENYGSATVVYDELLHNK